MIYGVVSKEPAHRLQPEAIGTILGGESAGERRHVVCHGPVALASADVFPRPRQATATGAGQPQDHLHCAWQGAIYNRDELAATLGLTSAESQLLSDPALLLRLYEASGLSCADKINGRFAFALYDARQQTLILGRDHLGIETLYIYDDPKFLVFSSRTGPIVAHPAVQKSLNPEALHRFLLFGYNPAWDTFFRGIRKVRPGSLVILNGTGLTEKRYWRLSFRGGEERSEADYCHDLRDLMREAVRLRVRDREPLGIFLSGGLDSSSVAVLARDLTSQALHTFSYRCFGKSFDESGYARLVAQRCQSEHHEIIYSPEDTCKMASIVELMDEPFCNAGINIATFLLGQGAQGKVAHILSGDGGDELFGGHPVYAADKLAARIERLPRALRQPFMALFRRLPDSDQKLNLTVKLKRFCEGLSYPQALGTHRWRIYYGNSELQRLLHPDVAVQEDTLETLCADLHEIGREADGPDMLSRSLYVDFLTEVGFYLRRMDLLRYFQLTPHFPLLDYRLVEYAATMPSSLKFRGLSDTKYIQHRAMEGILPDEIIHRKDKLGHSVPFKNWLRQDPVVKQFVQETLTDRRLGSRGLVNSRYVQRLWDDHQHYRRNNSHTIWTLTVLELWLAANNF
jgi:asparagine synthase (glutamine-hydrolysing)